MQFGSSEVTKIYFSKRLLQICKSEVTSIPMINDFIITDSKLNGRFVYKPNTPNSDFLNIKTQFYEYIPDQIKF